MGRSDAHTSTRNVVVQKADFEVRRFYTLQQWIIDLKSLAKRRRKHMHAEVLALLSYNARVMIAKDLLDILVCPACKKSLEYRQSPETLKCTQCRRVYAVKDNIPIMLVDEAVIEP